MNVQNNAGYTAVMLASLTAPDRPGGMEVVRKLMEQGDVNVRSSQVTLSAGNGCDVCENSAVISELSQTDWLNLTFLKV